MSTAARVTRSKRRSEVGWDASRNFYSACSNSSPYHSARVPHSFVDSPSLRYRGWPRNFSGSRSDRRLLAEVGSVVCSLERPCRPDFIWATRECVAGRTKPAQLKDNVGRACSPSLNRRMRTRMSGGMGRVIPKDGPYPISWRFQPRMNSTECQHCHNKRQYNDSGEPYKE